MSTSYRTRPWGPAPRLQLTSLAALLLAVTACEGRSPNNPEDRNPPARGDDAREDDGGGSVSKGPLKRYAIDQAAFPEAVCNDGTTPVFYFRPGAEEDKWVVWFKGGGSCLDAASCAEREGSLTSSRPWMKIDTLGEQGNANSEDGSAGGILSTNPDINPDFHDWNHVYLVYCSSDNWAGNRGLSDDTYGMHFRGHHITTAMFEALEDPKIVGSTPIDEASEVILTGSSAGAAGLRNNIDRLAPRFPKAKVRGFSDAFLVPETTPKRVNGDEGFWKLRTALWNPIGDESCGKVHTGDDAWKCFEGRFLAVENHLQTPTFFHMDLRDPKIMGDYDRKDPEAVARSRTADIELRTMMSNLEGAFAPANNLHIVLDKAAFSRETCKGYSAAEVFGNWYFDRSGPKQVIDDSTGEGNRDERGAGRGRGERDGKGGGHTEEERREREEERRRRAEEGERKR